METPIEKFESTIKRMTEASKTVATALKHINIEQKNIPPKLYQELWEQALAIIDHKDDVITSLHMVINNPEFIELVTNAPDEEPHHEVVFVGASPGVLM